MDHHITDTELTIPDRRPQDRSLKLAHPPHTISKRTPFRERNGQVISYKISRREMRKLWRD